MVQPVSCDRSTCLTVGTLGTKNMNKLLLLTPLLLGAGALPRQAASPATSTGERLEAAQAPDEETRSVTIDITGMT